MSKSGFEVIAEKIGKTLALPVIVYAVFQIAARLSGVTTFGVGNDLLTIIFTTVYTGFISLGMSFNLMQGRIDYGIGATMILTGIIGGNFAIRLGLNPFVTLLVMLATGAVLGAVSGLVYNLLKLPAMITGIGMAMVYEGLTMILFKGNGVRFSIKQTNAMFSIGTMPWNVVVLILVVAALVFLYQYTKFGYNSWALTGNPRIAANRGINEKSNAVICYMLSGIAVGFAIYFYCWKYGYVAPAVSLSTGSYLITGFLPFAIGELMAKYSDMNVAVVIGAFCQACLTSFMVNMGFSTSVQTVINGVVICLLLIYSSNAQGRSEKKMIRAKLAKLKGTAFGSAAD